MANCHSPSQMVGQTQVRVRTSSSKLFRITELLKRIWQCPIHPSYLIHDKVVLELGAGLGLCGIVAGLMAKEVIITDYNHTVLSQLQDNVDLNRLPGEYKKPFIRSTPLYNGSSH